MRKIYIISIVLFQFFLVGSLLGQSGECLSDGCSLGVAWGSTQSTTSTTFVNSVANTFGGEYNTYNVTAGQQYEWSLCPSDGAIVGANTDSQLSLTNNSNNAALCHSDNHCGNHAKILWTATFTGVVRVYIHTSNCQSQSTSHTVRWRCISCSTIPCSETTITLNMLDTYGDGWNGANMSIINTNSDEVIGTYTLTSGYAGTQSICLPDGCYRAVLSAGNFPSEIGWSLVTGTTTIASASAPTAAPFNTTFTIGSASCIPPSNNECSAATVVNLGANANQTFSGSSSGSTNDPAIFGANSEYSQTWLQIIVPCGGMNVSLNYCNNPVLRNNAYINLFTNCSTNPGLISATNFNYTNCPNGSVTLNWENLPEGIYYYPLLQNDLLWAGNYTVNVIGTPLIAPSVAPTTIIGNNTICQGENTTLLVSGGNTGTGGTAQWYTGSCGESPIGSGTTITLSPPTTTTYFVRYENACNVTACQQITIAVNDIPTANAGDALTSICQGETSSPMGGSVDGYATSGTWSGGTGFWTNATDPVNATYTAGPSESGSILITLTTNGGSCGIASASKTITINPSSAINPSTSVSAPILCLNLPLVEISHSTSNVSGINSIFGLPAGVTATFNPSSQSIIISGTPSSSGTFNYVITPQGCGTATATGEIVIQAPEPEIIVEENIAAIGDYVWNGLISNNWNDIENWYVKTDVNSYSSAQVSPTNTDNVFIVPNSIGGNCVNSANNPIINTPALGNSVSSNLIVHPQAQLIISPNSILEVSGNFEGYGAISFGAGSKLKFIGNDSTTIYIGNPENNVIYDLEMSKTNDLVLLSDIHISNEVLFNNGNIRLNFLTMDLGSTGFFTNESENSHAYCDCTSARIVRTVNIDAGETIDAGNLGLSITPEVSMGTIRLERRHRRIVEPFNGMTESIARYYSVKDIDGGFVQNNGKLNATLVFNYLNAESNLNNAPLNLYHQAQINSLWNALGGYHDPTAKTVTYINFQSFSFVTLGPSYSALPVTLTSFNANCNGDKIEITWTTESEYNSSHFSLQNSKDGVSWTEVAQLEAAGTTNQTTVYHYEDNKKHGVSYYRLVQTDFDGSTEDFPIISVNCELESNVLSVYPNPTSNGFILNFHTHESFDYAQIEMEDMYGRNVKTKELNIVTGQMSMLIETDGLRPGTYIIYVKTQNLKFVPIRIVVI